ncbi:MAG: hypothetical protein C4334_00285 [Pyrinomonas sp.]
MEPRVPSLALAFTKGACERGVMNGSSRDEPLWLGFVRTPQRRGWRGRSPWVKRHRVAGGSLHAPQKLANTARSERLDP